MIEIIGWITIFLCGGYVFAVGGLILGMVLFDKHGLAAFAYAKIFVICSLVLWLILFFWFSPIVISFTA